MYNYFFDAQKESKKKHNQFSFVNINLFHIDISSSATYSDASDHEDQPFFI